MSGLTESIVEGAALAWLDALGYAFFHGPDIAVGALRVQAAPRIVRRLTR